MEEVRAGYLQHLWMGYSAPPPWMSFLEIGFGDRAAEVVS